MTPILVGLLVGLVVVFLLRHFVTARASLIVTGGGGLSPSTIGASRTRVVSYHPCPDCEGAPLGYCPKCRGVGELPRWDHSDMSSAAGSRRVFALMSWRDKEIDALEREVLRLRRILLERYDDHEFARKCGGCSGSGYVYPSANPGSPECAKCKGSGWLP